MKRSYLLLALSIILLLPVLLLQAETECDVSRLKADIQAQLTALDEDAIGAIRQIISLAVRGLHDCSEETQSFSGRKGAQPVLGPLALAEGLHVVTMTTEGSARIDSVAVEGCGKDLDSVVQNFSVGQGIRGAANLVEVESDCVFYLEFSKITADWTLTIEKVR